MYDQHPDVVATEMVARRPGFRRDEEAVLAVDVAHIDRVTPLARQARQLSAYPVGDLACFNVDFSREFRYCLENSIDPTPASELSTYSSYGRVGHSPARYNVPGRAIIDARDEIKAAIRREKDRDNPDEDRLAELEGRSGALKWILVACFGYQGFSNAKFGRIECHETINAFAREILLTAKQRLEAGGWRVVHGIVDSIWVTPDPDVEGDDREDLETLATEVTKRVEVRLEHEAHYDWVAFVPQRESDAGALTKYFGKVAGENDFKIRGIEARQRSTPPFIEDVQRDCLQDAIKRLHAGTVPVEQLVERNRVSKPLEGVHAEHPERGGAEAGSRAGPCCPPGTGHRVRGRRRREDLARTGRVGS